MTDETMHDRDGVLPVDLDTARAAAWAEHERRCADDEPYTGGVTVGALVERVEAAASSNSAHAWWSGSAFVGGGH